MFKEYFIENNDVVYKKTLQAPHTPQELYSKAHAHLMMVCHDVFVSLNGGILLVNRDNAPCKDEMWCIGGRMLRGLSAEESLKQKALTECGLVLKNIQYLGTARTAYKTDPFNHGNGTDTLNLVYAAEGIGKLKLDNLHSKSIIVKPENYTAEFRDKLNPYVRDFLDICIINIMKLDWT